MSLDGTFWHGRRVFVTGHTGFKGAWLTLWLSSLGAEVTGLSAGVPTEPSLYALAAVSEEVRGLGADVRDAEAVRRAIGDARPDVVLHLAAQPFVRRSYEQPAETWAVNVDGTINVLDAVRHAEVPVTVVVTSDKCYDNREQRRPFVETDPMGGHDPYSSSKGAAELAVDAWRRSYGIRVATGRAGNVIGGGDWGEDRLIPDIMRAAGAGSPIAIRRPDAIRPWQHVLEPLSGYLLLAERLWTDADLAAGWNFGPDPSDAQPVSHVVERVTALWPDALAWDIDPGPHPHEAGFLALDSTKAREQLGWAPRWDLDAALERIVEWHVGHCDGADLRALTLAQIAAHGA
ncbi:MAG TPA: CDP-glucose 4,6-dehydratase [Solirubrobacteraceae bacterium]|nr:CDP-glucose 4,6-dehydratase [Solirubrobacteraceae bacterium]